MSNSSQSLKKGIIDSLLDHDKTLFSETDDMRIYWKDDSSRTEMTFYGYDSDTNGKTADYQTRTVVANISYEECLREYARSFYQLNEFLELSQFGEGDGEDEE